MITAHPNTSTWHQTSPIFHYINSDAFQHIANQHMCLLSHHTRPISHSTSIPMSYASHQSPQTTLWSRFKGLTQPAHWYWRHRNGMMESTYQSFTRLQSSLSIIDPHNIADRSFSIPLGSVSGLTLRCFVLHLFLLLLPCETRYYLYSLP